MFFPFHDENPIERTPFVTVAIIVINVFVLIYMISLGGQNRDDRKLRQFIYTNGFIPARIVQLRDPKPMVFDMYRKDPRPIPPVERSIRLPPDRGQIIQSAFTAMFIHAGWFHLISNMWFFLALWKQHRRSFGAPPVLALLFRRRAGRDRLPRAVAQGPASLDPVVGASGAVAVTLGAYAVFYPFAKVKTLDFCDHLLYRGRHPRAGRTGHLVRRADLQGVQRLTRDRSERGVVGSHRRFLVGAALMPLLAAATPGTRRTGPVAPRWIGSMTMAFVDVAYPCNRGEPSLCRHRSLRRPLRRLGAATRFCNIELSCDRWYHSKRTANCSTATVSNPMSSSGQRPDYFLENGRDNVIDSVSGSRTVTSNREICDAILPRRGRPDGAASASQDRRRYRSALSSS